MATDSVCCPPGSLKYLEAAYTPIGAKITIGDGAAEAYTSGNLGNKAVVIIPDIWGWDSGRTRAVADHLAALGYYVIVPKLLVPALEGGTDGDGLPPTFDLGSRFPELKVFLATISWETSLKPKIAAVLAHLEGAGTKAIAFLGFCWGGWVAAHACVDFPKQIIAVAVPHPSIHLEDMFQGAGAAKALCSKVATPFLLLPAGNDGDIYRPGGDLLEALKINNAASHASLEFGNTVHGFVPRGDVSDPVVAESVKLALSTIEAFFAKYI